MTPAKIGDTFRIHFTGKFEDQMVIDASDLKEVQFADLSKMMAVNGKCYGQWQQFGALSDCP